jgi:hypothetical protein
VQYTSSRGRAIATVMMDRGQISSREGTIEVTPARTQVGRQDVARWRQLPRSDVVVVGADHRLQLHRRERQHYR